MIQWFHLLMEWMASQLVNLNATLCFVGFPPALISFNGTLESNLADERALFQNCRCSRIQPDVLSNGESNPLGKKEKKPAQYFKSTHEG